MGIVLVINEEFIDDPIKLGCSDPHSFLDQTPRGAYTVASVLGEYNVHNWHAHIERLIKSIAALHTTLRNDMYTAYYKVCCLLALYVFIHTFIARTFNTLRAPIFHW